MTPEMDQVYNVQYLMFIIENVLLTETNILEWSLGLMFWASTVWTSQSGFSIPF